MALPLSLPSPRAFFAFLCTPLYWTTFHHYLEAWNPGNEVHYRGLENYKSSHAVLRWFACGPQLSYGGRTATFNPKVFRRSDTSFSWQCCSPCSVSSKAYLILLSFLYSFSYYHLHFSSVRLLSGGLRGYSFGVSGVPHELTPPSTLPDWSLLMHNGHVSDKNLLLVPYSL